jgi:HSP20 family molecular chaperone IbpA
MRAEREILGEIAVDMQVTDASVTALASLPEFGGREITLGLEPRWMVVFAQRLGDGDGDGHSASWREDHGDGHAGGSGPSRPRGRRRLQRKRMPMDRAPRYAFCSVELPEEVDPAKCCAVFHDRLLGVRVLRRG